MAFIPTFLAGGKPPAAGLVVLDLDLGQDADGRWVNGADQWRDCASGLEGGRRQREC